MKIPSFFTRISFQKSIAAFLVLTILISQTIHVDFFDSVEAGRENYRDIVSIIVDSDTYRAERSRIMQYAGDIAGYLGGVRTSILVVEKNTPVAAIAAKNEKLYYEGDGEGGTSSLVGTILIGDIPIPVVEKEGTRFPSLYPYLDFTDKVFVYDQSGTRYTYNDTNPGAGGVDIWHGVINPSVGRSWSGATDIQKIGKFLDKTHEFYTHSGKFVPSTIPPKVLYYDGFSESRSISMRSLFQYGLSMKNAENIAYSRFTKYLLRDVSAALKGFDTKNAEPDVVAAYASLGIPQGNDVVSEEDIKKLPDIQTRNVILSFLKNFKGIFNEKTLGDELFFVHNAGRYTSGSTVRADLVPVSITLMDEIAQSTLRESNNALENKIDTVLVDKNYARRIPIFDEVEIGSGTTNRNSPHMTIYQNYSFGMRSTEIHAPVDCTIARGSTGVITDFGRSQLVEANVAFDISQTEAQIKILEDDTEILTRMGKPNCFPNGKPRIDSYWGGNSVLRVVSGSGNPSEVLETFPTPTTFTGFTKPIFSLGGMKESDRLPIGSVMDCLPGYQYVLKPARLMSYTETGSSEPPVLQSCSTAYPDEWNRELLGICSLPEAMSATPRYTCISDVTSTGTVLDFASEFEGYTNTDTYDCIFGSLKLDGTVIGSKQNTCIIGGDAGIDITKYKNITFHTIPSIYKHTSPTDEEIAQAKANEMTPSIPVDMVRYVEFLTPKGNIARIHYPNFFDLTATGVVSAREWITEKSRQDWESIIAKERTKVLTQKEININRYLSGGVLPTQFVAYVSGSIQPSEFLDWNVFISDEMITKIIQAKNWLHPDIAIKYKQAIESMLSYSQGASGATTIMDIPPKIPTLSDEYEIAYLGLPSSFDPDFSLGIDSTLMDNYATRLREIEGANISEVPPETNNPAAECGPPDGVPLFQWPSAIICWIKAQFPPRILAGSCGPTTIGIDSPQNMTSVAPPLGILGNTGALLEFYSGAQLITHLPRSSMQLQENLLIDFSLQKNNTLLGTLPGAIAHLEIMSGSTGTGKKIEPADFEKYLIITPRSMPVGETVSTFLLASQGKEANFSLQGYYTIPLPDGSDVRINSGIFQIHVTPEYFAVSLEQSGALISNIDVTATGSIGLNIQKILRDGTSTGYTSPVGYKIYDDIDGSLVYSGSIRSIVDSLPSEITKKTGVYRLIVQDTRGIMGEVTFAVQAGPLTRIRITPVSSVLVRGSRTLAMVELLDRFNNLSSPDLHTLKIDVSGGYIVDANGDKKTTMSMDILESQVPMILGSDTGGKLIITATVDNTITATQDIDIYNTAHIVLIRDGSPQVGGPAMPAHIEIQNGSGQKISGLSGIASWKLPDGAGVFSKDVITITDGISEGFSYIPGTIAGEHALTIDIPGIGAVSDIIFSLAAGDPLYINHVRETDTITFALRDRYGNLAKANLAGNLSRNSDAPKAISFKNGLYTIPLQGGYYTIKVPGLSSYGINYTDTDGTHTIQGLDTYIAYIKGKDQQVDFAPDYNARYTVLAGGDFLSEGEDILYNTTPGASQSLAVSTSLDSPYREDIFLYVFPDGSYRLGSSSDMALQSSISLQNNIPLLTVSDVTTQKQVARVLYPMGGAILNTCQQNQNNNCNKKPTQPTIRLILPKGSDLKTIRTGNTIDLKDDAINVLSVHSDGSLILPSGTTLVPEDRSGNGLQMSVMQGGIEMATLIYFMDDTISVQRVTGDQGSSSKNTPIILSAGFFIKPTYGNSFSTETVGYKIFRSLNTQELDETKNSPTSTDSIGALSEIPGVGWNANNTMILAYAGGDTVGEATRFFQTYTFVNLGDPVAHIDHGRPGTEIEGIDRSIGSIITRDTRRGISDFFHRDMDHDGIEDISVVYDDGFIELFLNQSGKFRSRGMIAYNRDIDSKKIAIGDFTHDGYADILGRNKTGSLILVDNTNRKFERRDIKLDGGAVVPTDISQLHVHDMDADGRDDIVYLTAYGELGILYGTDIPGNFVKKILDASLGIALSNTPIIVGGAIKTSQTPQFQGTLGDSPTTSTGVNDSMLKAEAFYQYFQPISDPTINSVDIDTLSGAFTDIQNGKTGNKVDTFVRSQYAPAYGIEIEKKYINNTHATLYTGDHITATIKIHNTGSTTLSDVEYLDSIPKIFTAETTKKYTLKKGNTSVFRDFKLISDNEFDAYFNLGSLAPGETLEIEYELIALPAIYGEMIVTDLEKGTAGADSYGDVGFKTSTTCGANMLIWASGGSRDYTRGTYEFGDAMLPDGVADRLVDSNNDTVPDSIQNMSIQDRRKAYEEMTTPITQDRPLIRVSQSGNQFNIGFDDQAVDHALSITQNLMDGLSCGFGGGSCINFPLNWAPAAPGNPMSFFGFPVQGTEVWATPSGAPTSIPVFSALTAINKPTSWGCYQIPTVWPTSIFTLTPTGTCSPVPGAGGTLGTASFSNFFRVFVTPTLTLGMGSAICMGAPAMLSGLIPPPGLSPLIKGGNCIVIAKPINACKGDGTETDGDVAPVSGLGTLSDTWNAKTCKPQANVISETEDRNLTANIVNYLKNPDTNKLTSIYTSMGNRGGRSTSVGPLLTVGSQSNGLAQVTIEIDANTKVSDISSVIKIKNRRIAAFPDFIMNWLDQQIEEITTALFTPPNLIIIPPTHFGQNAQVDSTYANFADKLGLAYSTANFANIKQGMVQSFEKGQSNTAGVPDAVKGIVGTTKGTLNSIKTAYTLIGRLPFISLKQTNIAINIPWIDMRELEKYKRALNGYMREFDNAQANWCIKDPSAACLDQKAKLRSGAFINSVKENLRRLDEYARFPTKIQKYITWKERYIAQILCNINTIQQITTGWLRDNGIRFRKWAELFVLVKAIAQSWQPLLDIFSDANKQCGVCRNERNNLQYWKLKLLSMLIPNIPVIRFPKWPDIILDLSDVRLGITISVPNFIPRISPIRLPELPSLSIGNISASLSLPAFPILPALPPLPDLPDLPSLPKIKLPDLPPPPKIPKIAGTISGFLSIMKLISKMYCYYQKTSLVPEWQAGDVIAQRTERQTTLPLDFINLSFPQFTLPMLKEIRVRTHVNFELRSDFITEFARSIVKPINAFQTDLQRGIPKKIGENVVIPSVNIDLNKKLQIFNFDIDQQSKDIGKFARNMEQDKDIFLEVGEFATHLLGDLNTPELINIRTSLQGGLKVAQIEADKVQNDLIAYNTTRFDYLREYLSSELDNNAHLQKMIEFLDTKTTTEPRQLIADISESTSRSTRLLKRFEDYQKDQSQNQAVLTTTQDRGVSDEVNQLQSKFSRMIAANSIGDTSSDTTTSSTTQSSNLATGYSPNYQGIYIHTPSGIQTRLFDYITPINRDTRVETTDIDRDGDTDYMFVLDNVLYVKYSWLKTPTKIDDATIKISSVSPNDLVPYVPDYFIENISTPKHLNYSFTPASPDETEWRAEFYDRYIEWDHIDIGDHDPILTPKTTIDMFLQFPTPPEATHSGILTHTVPRSLVSVRDQGTFVLQGRSIDIYTGALSMSISPGRILYTGQDTVRILYKNESTSTGMITLQPHMGYSFAEMTEITTSGGKLYVIGEEDHSRYTYSDTLRGVPILPGMQLYASNSGAIIQNHTNDTNIILGGGETYIAYDLGDRAEHYEIVLPYSNGYYYTRLQNLTDTKRDRAGVVLFAPQASSDDGAPIIDLPMRLRLPTYASKTYKVADVFTDLSSTIIEIDENTTTDSNGNGVFDDDFSASGSLFTLSGEDITFGPFVAPGMYSMLIKVTDEMNNVTTMPFTIEVYTLIPQIRNLTATGTLIGELSERYGNIPVHFFRIRPGEGPQLLLSRPTLSDIGGVFATGSFFKSPEIISFRGVGYSGVTNTGTIDTHGVFRLSTGSHTEVMSATASDPMRILTINQSGSVSHIHSLSLPETVRFVDRSKDTLTSTGVLFTPTNTVRIIPADARDASIPSGIYITDATYHPLAAMARDGNIYILDTTITLQYSIKNGYMTLVFIKQGVEILTVEYHIDFFYTML